MTFRMQFCGVIVIDIKSHSSNNDLASNKMKEIIELHYLSACVTTVTVTEVTDYSLFHEI